MDKLELLADRFEEQRPHLRAVAYRMLGSLSEADDAVQETWLRVSRADHDGIDNLRAWLTTITAGLPERAQVARLPARGAGRRPPARPDHRSRRPARP